jgi:probable F420-dependent oxidoreductase
MTPTDHARRGPDVLGCYIRPGQVEDPRPGIAEARAAETLGLGTVWISERYDAKDLPALAGAITQVTSRVRIAAGTTHIGTRHPMSIAGMGLTLQALSGERFVLGFARSSAWRWNAYGVKKPTMRMMEDMAGILRRLWAGETVTYDGPAGTFPELRLYAIPDVAPPPLVLAAIGPKTLALAGRSFDGVILHPFLSPAAVERSVAIVREAAAGAGRDPSAVRVHATVVVASDRPQAEQELIVGGRAAGYLQKRDLGNALATVNGWDFDQLERFRAQPRLAAVGDRAADRELSREDMGLVGRALPDGWLTDGAAIGSPQHCAERFGAFLDAGADELILHGSTADQLGDVVAAFADANR